MRHQRIGKKFGRKKGIRNAFRKGLIHNLIMREKLTTTVTRAKETARLLGPFVTLAKKQTLAAYRKLLERLPKQSAEKLYKDIALRFGDRRGGVTRIAKLKRRNRDGALMASISFVEEAGKPEKPSAGAENKKTS